MTISAESILRGEFWTWSVHGLNNEECTNPPDSSAIVFALVSSQIRPRKPGSAKKLPVSPYTRSKTSNRCFRSAVLENPSQLTVPWPARVASVLNISAKYFLSKLTPHSTITFSAMQRATVKSNASENHSGQKLRYLVKTRSLLASPMIPRPNRWLPRLQGEWACSLQHP